jgi:type II secretory pathway component PulC
MARMMLKAFLFSTFAMIGTTISPAMPFKRTALPIDLVGVIVNPRSPKNSVCLVRLAAAPNKIEVAQSGDKVFHLAEIRAVEHEKIVLKNLISNMVEDLYFGKIEAAAPFPPPPKAQVVDTPNAPQGLKIGVPKDVVEYFKANLKEFLDTAYATPHVREDNGKQVIDGFEINRVQKGAIVDQLGIREGDIIVEANGVNLDSLTKVISVYQLAQKTSQIDLVIIRQGKRLKITFQQK